VIVNCVTEVGGIDASRARRFVPRPTFHCCTGFGFTVGHLMPPWGANR
jgi:hypothetical protein